MKRNVLIEREKGMLEILHVSLWLILNVLIEMAARGFEPTTYGL